MNVVLSLSLCDVGETFVVVFVKLFYYKEMGIAGAGGAHSLMAYCYIIYAYDHGTLSTSYYIIILKTILTKSSI